MSIEQKYFLFVIYEKANRKSSVEDFSGAVEKCLHVFSRRIYPNNLK